MPGQSLVLTASGGFESAAVRGESVAAAAAAGGGVKRVNYWEDKNGNDNYDEDVDEDEDKDEDEDEDAPRHQSKKLKT